MPFVNSYFLESMFTLIEDSFSIVLNLIGPVFLNVVLAYLLILGSISQIAITF